MIHWSSFPPLSPHVANNYIYQNKHQNYYINHHSHYNHHNRAFRVLLLV